MFNPNTDGIPYVYGQINKGFLIHSDGHGTGFYPLVDNANSSTRGGIRYVENWWSNVVMMANVEGEWKPYASDNVSQLNSDNIDWGAVNLRKLEVQFDRIYEIVEVEVVPADAEAAPPVSEISRW